jgi:hypothetical protein
MGLAPIARHVTGRAWQKIACHSPDGSGICCPPRHRTGRAVISHHVIGWAWYKLPATFSDGSGIRWLRAPYVVKTSRCRNRLVTWSQQRVPIGAPTHTRSCLASTLLPISTAPFGSLRWNPPGRLSPATQWWRVGNRPLVHFPAARCLARCWGTGPRFTLQCQCPGASPGVGELAPGSLYNVPVPPRVRSPGCHR